ncbi:MAG TPA: 4-(cytidine 5'-diphospho)-2-C-methyl-D-erythritol kinase [Pseudorhodoplanes sp.]|jgi:4-diphosphocytidyl-2-C-methyl-D-erythritol kinase|nr:4-(cytidine 5'-diphospho)-2-C-methyl-D-erythritol kinase [Pseudorhodoplanes sp.]
MFVEFAPAKINLTLRVIGRRADGYHEIESLVVFTRPRDRLCLDPGADLSLAADGPTAPLAGDTADNLVLKAAAALRAQIPNLKVGRFALWKVLPVAAGIGGGSSDAAAALRCLARANGLAADDARLMRAARQTGADVPVCLDPRPRMMRGIGDILSPALSLPDLPAVLVNPGVGVPTGDVFKALAAIRAKESPKRQSDDPTAALARAGGAVSADQMIDAVSRSINDLEGAAISVQPLVADVIAALRALPGCRLARMSGSGATCFGLFDRGEAPRAARLLRRKHPGWWVKATVLGGFAPALY